jgi:hypothetical protein
MWARSRIVARMTTPVHAPGGPRGRKHNARRFAVVLALVAVVGLAACGDDDSDDAAGSSSTTAVSADGSALSAAVAALENDSAVQQVVSAAEQRTTYVGTVDGTDAYIAIVDDGAGGITAYVCDGKQLGAWAEGERSGDAVSASGASGLKVDATITGSDVSGTAVVPGWGSHTFRATEAEYPAGLWQPLDTESGEFAGLKVGWILLDEANQRGLALTSKKKLELVDPVNVVGGPAGSSTTGPVTTDGAFKCRTIQNVWNHATSTAAGAAPGSDLKASAEKAIKLAEDLWLKEGCPGDSPGPSTE